MARRILGFFGYYASFFYYRILLPAFDWNETEQRFRSRLRKSVRLSLWFFGVRLVLEGEENLCRDGNAIIVANHSSWFAQLALLAALDRPITFMANEKYFRIWGLATILRKLDSVPVYPDSETEGASATKSLNLGKKVLEEGKWLVIFPEGTRSSHLLPFRRGAAILAQKTGLPTQSIVIHGARDVLPRRKSFLHVKPGFIRLEIRPLAFKERTESAAEFTRQIETGFTAIAFQESTVSE